MRVASRLFLGLALLTVGATGADAQIVFDHSDDSGIVGGDPFISEPYAVATRFVLASASTIGGVTFWGGESLDWSGSTIQWAIYSAGTDRPGSMLASGASIMNRTREASDRFPGSWVDYVYDFSIGSHSFVGGTYWLALHIEPVSGNSFYWERGVDNDGIEDVYVQSSNGTLNDFSASNPSSYGLRYQLTGAETVVPEPISMVLLGTGLFGVGASRLRRRREGMLQDEDQIV